MLCIIYIFKDLQLLQMYKQILECLPIDVCINIHNRPVIYHSYLSIGVNRDDEVMKLNGIKIENCIKVSEHSFSLH